MMVNSQIHQHSPAKEVLILGNYPQSFEFDSLGQHSYNRTDLLT